MNKNIFSIFVIIMTLSLFGVSCSNNATKPNNSDTSSGSDTPVVVDQNSMNNAIKSALGERLQISANPDNFISTAETVVVLSDASTGITIPGGTLDVSTGSRVFLTEYLNGLSTKIKDALTSQGIIVDGDLMFNTNYIGSPTLTFDITATSITPSTDEQAFTLPNELKGKNSITITLSIVGDVGDWGA